MVYFISAAIGYLLGSICFAIPVSRLMHHDDVRGHGSGNAGMTNILRTYGWISAVLVFAGDFLKGIAAVLLTRLLFPAVPQAAYLAAFCAVLGHLYPLYYGFRGGKGVVVTAGVILMFTPRVLLFLAAVWLALAVSTRYFSLASIAAAALYPIATAYALRAQSASPKYALWLALATAVLVLLRHRENIRRLAAGTESRFGRPKQ